MAGSVGPGAEKLAFRWVFWGLAVVEAAGLAYHYRERFAESLVGTLAIVTLVPVLVLGHVNVFPAFGAAWLVRRRVRQRAARGAPEDVAEPVSARR